MTKTHGVEKADKDSEALASGPAGASQQGRAGGNLQRDIATQDALKRAGEQFAGITRVTGESKRNHGESA